MPPIQLFFSNLFPPTEQDVVIPVASHLRGVTVSAEVVQGTVDWCRFALEYPDNPSLRPFNQIDPTIVRASLRPPANTIHIPLPDLFVGEAVPLTIVGTLGNPSESNSFCRLSVSLHLRPLPGGIQP